MNVPNDGTLELAEIYMIVIFVGMIGTHLDLISTQVFLQGLGDSRHPLTVSFSPQQESISCWTWLSHSVGWACLG